MISRRLLRIKALMALYAFNRRKDDDLNRGETELMFSIEKTYELYHLILQLILDISDIAAEKINLALQKKMPTYEDLNPITRFVDNLLIAQLRKNIYFNMYTNSKKLSWSNNRHIPRLLYNKMILWDEYSAYLKSEQQEYASDKRFVLKLVTEMISSSEDLQANLEEQSIYWNDDMDYVMIMIEKTLKKFRESSDEKTELMPLFKNSEDEDFVKILFRKAIIRSEQCSGLIENNTANWEVERIALMDILVMQLAITEIIEFPEIPVKVTLNEYIEIAKYYCTAKSSTFVNGILDNIIKEMREKDIFAKFGRGLVGETAGENSLNSSGKQ